MTPKDGVNSIWEVLSVTITSGTALTNKIDLGGLRLFSVVPPSSWTAASLTFQVSYDNGTTWYDVYKDGVEYTHTVTAGKNNDVDIQRVLGPKNWTSYNEKIPII